MSYAYNLYIDMFSTVLTSLCVFVKDGPLGHSKKCPLCNVLFPLSHKHLVRFVNNRDLPYCVYVGTIASHTVPTCIPNSRLAFPIGCFGSASKNPSHHKEETTATTTTAAGRTTVLNKGRDCAGIGVNDPYDIGRNTDVSRQMGRCFHLVFPSFFLSFSGEGV